MDSKSGDDNLGDDDDGQGRAAHTEQEKAAVNDVQQTEADNIKGDDNKDQSNGRDLDYPEKEDAERRDMSHTATTATADAVALHNDHDNDNDNTSPYRLAAIHHHQQNQLKDDKHAIATTSVIPVQMHRANISNGIHRNQNENDDDDSSRRAAENLLAIVPEQQQKQQQQQALQKDNDNNNGADCNFFRIGKRKLVEDLPNSLGGNFAPTTTNKNNNGNGDGEMSCSVRLAKQMDHVQTVLVRNSILLREVQSAYVSLLSHSPLSPHTSSLNHSNNTATSGHLSSGPISASTHSHLRQSSLQRGGEMLAEINKNLTIVSQVYEQASQQFMQAVHESSNNFNNVNNTIMKR